ncbi:MAG: hypothetical protein ACREF3_04025 [Acetobacteraceae bacterium]
MPDRTGCSGRETSVGAGTLGPRGGDAKLPDSGDGLGFDHRNLGIERQHPPLPDANYYVRTSNLRY